MTRKQEIEEMAKTTASHITSDKDMQVAFADVLKRGAEWADEHPMTYDGKAMLYVNNRSHENGYKEAVDKACEWLKDYAYMFVSETTGDLYEDDLINEFRKDMKGE